MDQITLKRIESAHPLVRDELLCIYEEIMERVDTSFSKIRFTEVQRKAKRQEELYAKGRTVPGPKVTWARAWESFHQPGLATDIAQLLDKDRNGTFETASWDTTFDGDKDGIADWLECARIFNSYGWQWGLINSRGRRYDLPHFQKTFGFTMKQIAKMPRDNNGYPILPI